LIFEERGEAAIMTAAPMDVDALHIRDLAKAFGGEQALRGVEFEVRPGEVHALVGSNGSGKSTLIKVLAGFHQPDAGWSCSVGDKDFELGSAASAEATGIRFVHQELGLIGNMDTVDNLGLGRGYDVSGGRIRWREERRRARALLEAVGVTIDVTVPVEEFTLAERTLIAIARATDVSQGDLRFLVLDEPTASLGGPDARRLFDVVERVRDNGVGVVLVSHHLDEVLSIADRVTVLRDGERVGTFDKAHLDRDKLIELMIGRRLSAIEAASSERQSGEPALVVRGLNGRVLRETDLQLWPGEILGVVGLTGSGSEELPLLLLGLARPLSGSIQLGSDTVTKMDPAHARKLGMWLVSGDRGKYGLVPPFSVSENITISNLSPFVSKGFLRRSKELADSRKWIETFDIKPASPSASITNLSGGNQQKAVLAKVLRTSVKVLVLDDPTRGVDVAAKAEIHKLMEAAVAKGMAILLCSSDHGEVARLCHRTLVMKKGVVTAKLGRSEVTEDLLDELVI
jgi:ribose transport system ATP-binding protein